MPYNSISGQAQEGTFRGAQPFGEPCSPRGAEPPGKLSARPLSELCGGAARGKSLEHL